MKVSDYLLIEVPLYRNQALPMQLLKYFYLIDWFRWRPLGWIKRCWFSIWNLLNFYLNQFLEAKSTFISNLHNSLRERDQVESDQLKVLTDSRLSRWIVWRSASENVRYGFMLILVGWLVNRSDADGADGQRVFIPQRRKTQKLRRLRRSSKPAHYEQQMLSTFLSQKIWKEEKLISIIIINN